MTRALIRRLLLVAGRLPRFVTIGDRDPQQQIRVTLEGLGPPVDVTRNHMVAALHPLTIALALPPTETLGRHPLCLRVSPLNDPEITLGVVGLRPTGVIAVERTTLQLFQPHGYTNACMPRGARAVFALHHAWLDWKRRKPRDFGIGSLDLGAVQVLYTCPRPVVLVTVQDGSAGNLFPMDLVGPTDSPYFLLALRNTSPSIPMMRASQRMALADVPLEYTKAAVQLGEGHTKGRIDWTALPFETGPSPAHGLPVLREALRVRDIQVRGVHVVGSHTLFITEVIREERRREGLQMFFISGSYYRRLVLRGTPPALPP